MKKTVMYIILLSIAVICWGCATTKPEIRCEISKPEQTHYMALHHFTNGYWYELQGFTREALVEYLTAINYDSTAIDLKIAAYNMYQQLKEYEGIISFGRKLYNQTGDLNYLRDVAEAYINAGNLNHALKIYKQLAELEPGKLTNLFHIGTLYLLLGDLAKAEEQYLDIYDDYPYRGQIETKLGRIMLLKGRFEEAKQHFKKAIYADVWEPGSHLGLSTCYELMGEIDSAAYYYRQYLDYNQDDQNTWQTLIDLYIGNDMYEDAAHTLRKYLQLFEGDTLRYQQLGITSYIIGDFNTALEIFLETSSWGDIDFSLYSYLGKSAMELKQYALVESSFIIVRDNIIGTGPWIDLALLYAEIDSTDKALRTLDIIKELFPNEPDLYYFSGIINAQAGRFEAAQVSFINALMLNPKDKFILFGLGDAYERGGSRPKAIKLFQRLVDQYPDDAIFLNYLGYILADEGIQLEYSLELITKALNRDPENGAYLDSYGWVLFRMGDYDEAQRQLERALMYINDDPVIYDHLGDVYMNMNQEQKAISWWEEALKFDMDESLRISIQEKLNELK